MTRIGIFWDYENCPPPRRFSGYEVIAGIKHAISDLGDEISTFKAYLDIHTTTSQTSNCQPELQSAGVTMVHCPHASRKEVADRVLVVDLMIFALEQSQPTSIVLISGDKDFSYATSKLQMKGHRVYLIYPSLRSTANSILNVASGVREWSSILSGDGKRFKKSPDASYQPLLVVDKKLGSDPFCNDSPNHSQPTTRALEANRPLMPAMAAPSSSDAESVGKSHANATSDLSSMILRAAAQCSSHTTGPANLPVFGTPVSRSCEGTELAMHSHAITTTTSRPLVTSNASSTSMVGPPLRIPLNTLPSKPHCNVNNLSPKLNALSLTADRKATSQAQKSKFKPITNAENAAEAFRARKKIDEARERQEIMKTTKQASVSVMPLAPSSAANAPPVSRPRMPFSSLVDVLLLERRRGKMSTPISVLELILRQTHPQALADFGASDIRDYVKQAESAGVVFFVDVHWMHGCSYVSLRDPPHHGYGDNLARLPLASREQLLKRVMRPKLEHGAEHFLQTYGLVINGDLPHFSKDGVSSLLERVVSGMRSLHDSGTMAGTPALDLKAFIGKKIAKHGLFRTLMDSAIVSGLVRESEGRGAYDGLELHPDIC